MPEAFLPSWQVVQLPAVIPVWFIVAGFQAVVLWHASQAALVWMCVLDLPFALVPLWQVAQLPAATPVWFIVAGFQAVVLWQTSQLALV